MMGTDEAAGSERPLIVSIRHTSGAALMAVRLKDP